MYKVSLRLFIVTLFLYGTSSSAEIELTDLGNPSYIYFSIMDEPAIGRASFRSLRAQ